MTFLNPLLLVGLIASAIPIILHLLNLRKLKTIEFSTLQFLKELQKTKMRRIKIRQWLLLAIRTLLIIAVVMAFSRPALRGALGSLPFGSSSTAKTTMVILLDDSPSMSVRNEHGVFMQQAKEAVSRIVDLFRDGDDLYFVRLSEVRHGAMPVATHAVAPIRKLIEQMTVSQETTPFRDALSVAAKILAESKNYNQEVYLVTDAQATQFQQSKKELDTLDLFPDKATLFITDVRSGITTEIENAGVQSVAVTSQVIAFNKPLALEATVQNAGTSALRSTSLSVYLDGSRVVQRSLDVASRSVVQTAVSVVPKRRGILQGSVDIEDDAFEMDNKGYFSVTVPSSIRVLAIGASQSDTRLPSLALTLDKDSGSTGVYSIIDANESQFASYDLNKFDLILLSNIKDVSSGEASRVTQFVESGGGLIIFPGKALDITNYNTVLFPKLGIPQAQPQRTFTSISSYPPPTAGSFLSFGKVDFAHPLFAELFEQRQNKKTQPTIESPKVYAAIIPQAGLRGRTIVSLSDGTPFLIEYERGAGRILLFSVEAGLSWSDFPLKGLFVPLLYRSGLYLTQSNMASTFLVGDELRFTIRLKNNLGKDSYVLRSPSGIDERIVPQRSTTSSLTTFTSANANEAGIYELRTTEGGTGGAVLAAIPVNINSAETDLRHASDDDMTRLCSSVGLMPRQVKMLSPMQPLDAAILESRFGIELWKYFVALALILAILEMIIGREARTKEGELS
jgi:hypothetical protein